MAPESYKSGSTRFFESLMDIHAILGASPIGREAMFDSMITAPDVKFLHQMGIKPYGDYRPDEPDDTCPR